jgi:hypothetical protein
MIMNVDMEVDNLLQMTIFYFKVITSKAKVTLTRNNKTISGGLREYALVQDHEI